MIETLCMASGRGHINCWLTENHDGDHFSVMAGIFWYKPEESGVHESRRDPDGDELAARRRLYRDRREEEAPATLAWSA